MADTLLNLYGARISKNGNHVNVTLVTDKGFNNSRSWFTAPVKTALDAKIHAEVNGNYAVIYVPLLKEEKKQEEIKDEDLPF